MLTEPKNKLFPLTTSQRGNNFPLTEASNSSFKRMFSQRRTGRNFRFLGKKEKKSKMF
jgi:hypothetical protein